MLDNWNFLVFWGGAPPYTHSQGFCIFSLYSRFCQIFNWKYLYMKGKWLFEIFLFISLQQSCTKLLNMVAKYFKRFFRIINLFHVDRAALKMANIDAVFQFMFTDPRTSAGVFIASLCTSLSPFLRWLSINSKHAHH